VKNPQRVLKQLAVNANENCKSFIVEDRVTSSLLAE
jgi:hypothetical protein